MAEFELVKLPTGKVRGYSQDDLDAVEKYVSFRKQLEPGELYSVRYWQSPDPVLHRKLMAMFRIGYGHWDPEKGKKRLRYKGHPIEKNFDRFRHDVMIRAGYFDASWDSRGRLHLDPKSIAYGKMSEDDKRRLVSAVADVLIKDILTNYTRGTLDDVIEELLRMGGTPT